MAAYQAPQSLGFSKQEHWSGLPFPSPMHESEKWKWSCSVMSDSSWPHGLQPTRLLHPWDFPGKNTGVGCHCLLRATLLGMDFLCSKSCQPTMAAGFYSWLPPDNTLAPIGWSQRVDGYSYRHLNWRFPLFSLEVLAVFPKETLFNLSFAFVVVNFQSTEMVAFFSPVLCFLLGEY